jgi:hypothetical protein
MNERCIHDWLYQLEFYPRDGKRYVCATCGLKVEHFEGRDTQIESRIKQAKLKEKNT